MKNGRVPKLWPIMTGQTPDNRCDRARANRDERPVKAAHFGMQARTTLMATPCRWGRKVARVSSSNTKLPPGLMA